MNKSDLVEAVALAANTSKTAAGRLVDSFTDTVREGLATGESVTMSGFGTFSVTSRQARQGRNPRTGQPVAIKARQVARFKVGARLAATVK